MGEEALARMSDRRNPLSPEQALVLHPDRLECWTDNSLTRRIDLGAVTQVRLAVEMAGQDKQVVCRVTGPQGEIVFGSRRANKGAFDDNVVEFQALMVALHTALKPRFEEVAFVEGQSLGFRLIMAGLGVIMAAAALFVIGWFAIVEESALLAFAGFPFLLIGGSLAWVFRPMRPLPYDPDKLIERFSGASS
ncbi:hypothetical protein NHF40_13065 [Maricaulaceae bacterium EIL42A08]|nr:hypothetical protein [Maricaulaceae bacterium EIL42A08]